MQNRMKLYSLKAIESIFLVLAVTILIIMVIYNNFVTMDGSEVSNISHNSGWSYAVVLLTAVAIIYIQKYLKRIPSTYIFWVCFAIFTACGLYLVCNVDLYLRQTDPLGCLNAAKHLNSHVYTDFINGYNGVATDDGYLNIYPYQLYWVSFLRILLYLGMATRSLYVLNLAFSLITLWSLYQVTCEVTKSSNIRSTVVIMTIMFLPLLFNVLFFYNNVIDLMLLTLSILMLLKGIRLEKQRWLFLTLSVLLMVVAGLFKNNYMIGLIALLITICLCKLNWRGKICLVLMPIVLVPISNKAMGMFYTHETGVKVSLSAGMPKSGFVLMGLNENGTKSGWYDGSTATTYKEANYSSRRTDMIEKARLKDRVKFLASHPKYSFLFFKQKLITTWSDPTFQSLWNAPLPTWGGKLKTKLMKSLYDPNGKSLAGRLVRKVAHVAVVLIMFFAIIRVGKLVKERKLSQPVLALTLITTLYFIGGVTFHLVWETKAQYVYQYVFALIPIASLGVSDVSDKIQKFRSMQNTN